MSVTPIVVQKEVMDIDLSHGVNERQRQEAVDWSKYLTTAENVTLSQTGALVKRNGTRFIAGSDDAGTPFFRAYRAMSFRDGVGIVANYGTEYYSLLQLNEGASKLVSKGTLSELSVGERYIAGSSSAGSGGTGLSNSYDTAVGSVYAASVHGEVTYGGTGRACFVEIMDRRSGQVIRRVNVGSFDACICMVDDRYFHIYASGSLTNTMYVYDTSTLTLSAGTTLTSTALIVGCVALDQDSSSVVLTVDGALERFNNSGTITHTRAGSGVTAATGIDYNSSYNVIVIAGYLTGAPTRYKVQKLSIALALSSTVTDTTAATLRTTIRVAVDTSGNMRLIATGSQATITAGVSIPCSEVYSCAVGATTFTIDGYLTSVQDFSHPFYNKYTNKFYTAILKQKSSVSGGAVTRDTTGYVELIDISSANANGYYRPVAFLDDYTGLATYADQATGISAYVVQKPKFLYTGNLNDSSTWTYAVEQQATALSSKYQFYELNSKNPKNTSNAEDVISGGVMCSYDGYAVHETGIADQPSVFLTDVASGGGIGAGTYSYVCVYEYVDFAGNTHYSTTSNVSSITIAGAKDVQVQVPRPRISGKASVITARIYRTTTGGTVYYLVGSPTYVGAGTYFLTTYTDTMTDATLITKTRLFRQPGTPNTSLDRAHSPNCTHVCRHKDRVFACIGNTVYYSSFAVDGEAPWFNAQFSFMVLGGTGPIVGLASMDGQLIIFKRDAIFVVDGDGPPENGGSGTEFSPPRRILTEFGCVDQRTIVGTPDGLFYRSTRGIELLSRSLQVSWIGESIADTVDAYKYVGGACFDRNKSRVIFTFGNALIDSGQGVYEHGLSASDNTGLAVVFDFTSGGWTTQKYNISGTAVSVQDVVYTKGYISAYNTQSDDKVFLIHPSTIGLLFESTDTKLDYYSASLNNYVPYTIETGWIRLDSHQDRLRASDFLFLAKQVSNHKVTISVAYDYSSSYSYSKTWDQDVLNSLTLEQVEVQIPIQAKQAVRFKIVDAAPSNTGTYPVGTGSGADIVALTVKFGKRGGGAKLPASQKG